MSLLQVHFEKVRAAEQSGQQILHGIYFDLMGTLMDRHGRLDAPLLAFAEWANREKIMGGGNHLITAGSMGGHVSLEDGGYSRDVTGIKSTEYKDYIFEEARKNGQRIALLIDDTNPAKKRWDDLVVTWWHPYDEEVREFLDNKDYLDFKL